VQREKRLLRQSPLSERLLRLNGSASSQKVNRRDREIAAVDCEAKPLITYTVFEPISRPDLRLWDTSLAD
jgi:hypothetical protein